ncbi:CNP1-like family protein [Jeongeupia naejangsanensis]|uniref:CNP1-like uncharacterized domain-containing protein n=1 Tax=Jeongeupia naejangsanensis TaxID=613195 RepID=A0ABS2BM18_9NEIS|nr:CNP1-like family protein [Jeongeupia naejangsanensis]MBM3116495.1 hypothetical protein [Jeongeupia naejangsanensis]
MNRLALITALLSLSIGAHAAEFNNPQTAGDNTGLNIMDMLKDKEQPAPAEKPFPRPDLATLKQWAPFTVNYESRRNSFYIAIDSITVSPDDKLVRYAVAVVPKGGVWNVTYEALDCNSAQYRVYAYGNGEGQWQDLNRKWQKVVKENYNAYSGELLDDFCRFDDPMKQDDIRSGFGKTRIEKPGVNPGGGMGS